MKRTKRRDTGMSQWVLGEAINIERADEKGKFDPSLPLAFRVARLLEMPIEDIFQDDLSS